MTADSHPQNGIPVKPTVAGGTVLTAPAVPRLRSAMLVMAGALTLLIVAEFMTALGIAAARGTPFAPALRWAVWLLDSTWLLPLAVPALALIHTLAGYRLWRATPWNLPKRQLLASRVCIEATAGALVLLTARMTLTGLFPYRPIPVDTFVVGLHAPPIAPPPYYFDQGWLLDGLSGILLLAAVTYAWHMVRWVHRARPYLNHPPGAIARAQTAATILAICASVSLLGGIIPMQVSPFLAHLPAVRFYLFAVSNPTTESALMTAVLLSIFISIPASLILLADILRLCAATAPAPAIPLRPRTS